MPWPAEALLTACALSLVCCANYAYIAGGAGGASASGGTGGASAAGGTGGSSAGAGGSSAGAAGSSAGAGGSSAGAAGSSAGAGGASAAGGSGGSSAAGGTGGSTISDTGDATNTGSGTAVSIAPGSTIRSGDVIVVSIHANTAGNTITDNNGSYAFTDSFQQDSFDTSHIAVFVRGAGASEPSTYHWTLARSQNWSAILRVFSGVDTSTIWDVPPSAGNVQGDASNTLSTATAPSITINTAGGMGIAQFYTDSPTVTYSTVDNGYGSQVQPAANEGQSSYIRIWSATGATGDTHARYSAANDFTALQFALKPAP